MIHTGIAATISSDNDFASLTELPSAPPSPIEDSGGLKVNKKRERELSTEPSTPNDDNESGSVEPQGPRVPTKKNRLEPLTPTDEDDVVPQTPPGRPSTPPMITSPQHESKVKQIQQRVEDMTWQDSNGVHPSNAADGKNGPMHLTDTLLTTSQIEEPLQRPMSETENIQTQADVPSDNDKEILGNESDTGGSQANEADDQGVSSDPQQSTPMAENPIKRKLDDRAISHISTSTDELRADSSKRPRDDPDIDPNPRETKRVSPPPPMDCPDQVPVSDPAVTNGFLAFASSSSPFTKATSNPSAWSNNLDQQSSKPENSNDNLHRPSSSTRGVTGSGSATASSSKFDTESKDSSTTLLKPKPVFGVTSAPGAGFTGFASFTSPFTVVSKSSPIPSKDSTSQGGPNRGKSPTRHGNAFTPYNTATRGFAAPKPSRKRRTGSPNGSSGSTEFGGLDEGSQQSLPESESEDRPITFSDKLREEKGLDLDENDDPKLVQLEEREHLTGEEDENTVFSVRGKLYILSDQKQWKERGIGPLKLNVRKSDGTGARLIMRKEGVHSLVLNIALFQGMKFEVAQDPRYVRFAAPVEGRFDQYNLRLSSSKVVDDLVDAIKDHIPQ